MTAHHQAGGSDTHQISANTGGPTIGNTCRLSMKASGRHQIAINPKNREPSSATITTSSIFPVAASDCPNHRLPLLEVREGFSASDQLAACNAAIFKRSSLVASRIRK